MIDYSKHKKGDTISAHCCNDCIINQGLIPKYPADSGVKSVYCVKCGHSNIGSTCLLTIGDWLRLQIKQLAATQK